MNMTLVNTFPREEKALKSRRAMLTCLQVVSGILMVLGTVFAGYCVFFGVIMFAWLVMDASQIGMNIFGILFVLLCLATVIAFSVTCYQVLGRFIGLCGELKQGTAFTQKNVNRLDKLASALRNGAIVLLPLTAVFMWQIVIANGGLLAMWMIPMGVFVFATLWLMLRGICLLTARAVDLQQDHDLTV